MHEWGEVSQPEVALQAIRKQGLTENLTACDSDVTDMPAVYNLKCNWCNWCREICDMSPASQARSCPSLEGFKYLIWNRGG